MSVTSALRHSSGWRRILILVGVLALATITWLSWTRLSGHDDPATERQFATVQRGDIEDVVTATGTLQPRQYVDVGAQVSGQLKKIHVVVGSQVKAGDLLAEIDPTVYLSRVDAARAQLRSLRAQLKDREAQLTLAQMQFRRQTALMEEDATTTENLQIAQASLASSAAQLDALRAQIEQNESTLRGDEANLRYARILSPMTGTVVSITARQGQTLNTNQSAPVILRVADLSTMTVQTQVSEADIGRLRIGMEAYFTTLGSQGKRWYGTLAGIEPTPTVTNNVVLYNALFDVPNADGVLMTQMTAQVFFVVAKAADVLQLPMGALTMQPPARRQRRLDASNGTPSRAEDTRQAIVQVLRPDNTIEARTIEIGLSSRVQAQVLSGLAEGDKVVSGAGISPDAPRRPARTPRL
ncbi:efflux RND transporter periplasmic adaptor subunit [Azoarcus sp. L1K30]|uniref:efflux RND transporter periplasmic adaptor subunit n=1 Tax=Azoarcus sp. L1K30 TaxID=2820277 RepID=UPI001B844A6F|nr:efflux RND transporter periplasmic adaptor subunit [Azoarcus sp. L1K30]MBR0566716.1 efflux RND transporter periplasmic adaptor subunit [Azoarcus sp. L1K30]